MATHSRQLNFTSAEQVNTFIRQAEQRIYNSIQFPPIRKNVTGTTTANNKYLSSPGDFLSVFSMAVIDPSTGAYDFLLNKDVNFIREAFPTPTSTGKPEYYALFGPTTTNNYSTGHYKRAIFYSGTNARRYLRY
jgi:hypothetical protein